MSYQKTIQTVVQAKGVGVHTGLPVSLSLRPAEVDTGVVFHRVDLDPVCSIPACSNLAQHKPLCTTLSSGGVSVHTVEHLLSALAGLGIDNVHVDVDAAELPIMDGSADPFVFLLQSAGTVVQKKLKSFIRIKKTVHVACDAASMTLEPFDGFVVHYTMDYDHPAFNEANQALSVDFRYASYERDIARARTFGFMKDYEALKQQNCAQGASLANTVAFDGAGVLNKGGLRYEKECVKHKVLDLIGDLALLTKPLLGSITAHKSGHLMNARLVKAVLDDPSCYDHVVLKEGFYMLSDAAG